MGGEERGSEPWSTSFLRLSFGHATSYAVLSNENCVIFPVAYTLSNLLITSHFTCVFIKKVPSIE